MKTNNLQSITNRQIESAAERLSPDEIQAGQLLQLERIANALEQIAKLLKHGNNPQKSDRSCSPQQKA